jgi:hypothetical protein
MVRRVDLCLCLFLLLLTCCSAAFAQEDTPRAEFNVGWSYLRSATDNTGYSGHGFNMGIAESATSWFQVEAQFDADFRLGGNHYDLYTTTIGPKIPFRMKRIAPFGHFLVGASYFRAFGRTGADFAMKMGGGVDFILTPLLSARVGVDDLVVWNPIRHYLLLNAGVVVRF